MYAYGGVSFRAAYADMGFNPETIRLMARRSGIQQREITVDAGPPNPTNEYRFIVALPYRIDKDINEGIFVGPTTPPWPASQDRWKLKHYATYDHFMEYYVSADRLTQCRSQSRDEFSPDPENPVVMCTFAPVGAPGFGFWMSADAVSSLPRVLSSIQTAIDRMDVPCKSSER